MHKALLPLLQHLITGGVWQRSKMKFHMANHLEILRVLKAPLRIKAYCSIILLTVHFLSTSIYYTPVASLPTFIDSQ